MFDVRLSKTAILIRNTVDVTCHVARLIGQFSGTDQDFDPGDIFVYCPGDNEIPMKLRMIPFHGENLERRNSFRGTARFAAYFVMKYYVYSVLKVTPCQVTCKLVKKYYWCEPDSARRSTVFVINQSEKQASVKFRFRHCYVQARDSFNKLMKSSLNPKHFQTVSEIDITNLKYDDEQNCFVW